MNRITNFVMKHKKGIFHSLVVTAMIFSAGFISNGYLKVDILGAFDFIKNRSDYSVTDVKIESKETNNEFSSKVIGYIYKGKKEIKEPYVVVTVEFYDNGKVVDKRSQTLDTAGLNVGDKRKFEVYTTKSFTDYKYYLE